MSDLNLTFQIEDAAPFEFDSIAGQAADDLSAAPRGLKRSEVALVQPRRPIRGQHAMRCAGHGIFRNPLARREVAAYEIVAAISNRGGDYAGTVEADEPRHVRIELAHYLSALDDCHVIEGVD